MTGKHIQLSPLKPQHNWFTGLCDTCDTYFNKKIIRTIQRHIHTFIECILLKPTLRNSFHFSCHSRHTAKTIIDTAFRCDASDLTVTPKLIKEFEFKERFNL